MSEIKKEMRWFSIMDYEKEGDYLSKRHQEGNSKMLPFRAFIHLKNVSQRVWFISPKWEVHLMDFNGYCYFRKPMAMMQQKEEIFAV